MSCGTGLGVLFALPDVQLCAALINGATMEFEALDMAREKLDDEAGRLFAFSEAGAG